MEYLFCVGRSWNMLSRAIVKAEGLLEFKQCSVSSLICRVWILGGPVWSQELDLILVDAFQPRTLFTPLRKLPMPTRSKWLRLNQETVKTTRHLTPARKVGGSQLTALTPSLPFWSLITHGCQTALCLGPACQKQESFQVCSKSSKPKAGSLLSSQPPTSTLQDTLLHTHGFAVLWECLWAALWLRILTIWCRLSRSN